MQSVELGKQIGGSIGYIAHRVGGISLLVATEGRMGRQKVEVVHLLKTSIERRLRSVIWGRQRRHRVDQRQHQDPKNYGNAQLSK